MRVRKWFFITSISVNLCLAIILFTPLTKFLCRPLIVDEMVENASVVVVLSGGGYCSGQLDFNTLIRLKKGVELYRGGIGNKIICAGGVYFEMIGKSIALLMKEELVFQQIPESDILIQDETINTYNDITYLINKFKNQFNFDRAVFVTSEYHTRRVKLVLKKKGLDAKVVSAYPYRLEPIIWPERMAVFRDIAREYLAIFYFKLNDYI
ncbi:YdcF family protein [Desulfobacula phenolica]|uniref:Uncharacterized SAM-binding protein YcdF, DUF218 family n=1 Tax=Desulfobacula phenolica TaxID=90732 RepID=A0A1H2DRS0_9BACT|nr:YdcF family protein [Desulfobacula phenolica]SDT85587.1 Uncharacterized SAM-binding protein YcdF, DUF218 family [Desulfobacula phenolica]